MAGNVAMAFAIAEGLVTFFSQTTGQIKQRVLFD